MMKSSQRPKLFDVSFELLHLVVASASSPSLAAAAQAYSLPLSDS